MGAPGQEEGRPTVFQFRGKRKVSYNFKKAWKGRVMASSRRKGKGVIVGKRAQRFLHPNPQGGRMTSHGGGEETADCGGGKWPGKRLEMGKEISTEGKYFREASGKKERRGPGKGAASRLWGKKEGQIITRRFLLPGH